MMKLYSDNILKLIAKTIREELSSNWEPLLEHSENIHDFDHTGKYYEDIHGNPIHGRADVNAYYLNTYNRDGKVHTAIESRFRRSNNILKMMPGLQRTFIAFIGPNSIIPQHVDDESRPAFDQSQCFNVLLGISVPSNDIEQIGLRVNTDSINQSEDHAVAFDANIPHDAWNRTDNWWICMVLLTEKEYVKS